MPPPVERVVWVPQAGLVVGSGMVVIAEYYIVDI